MKRLILAGSTIVLTLLASGVALAQEGSGLGPPEGEVAGISGSLGGGGTAAGAAAGGSAFTGAEVAGLIAAATLLVVLGTLALVLTRRRARAIGT